MILFQYKLKKSLSWAIESWYVRIEVKYFNCIISQLSSIEVTIVLFEKLQVEQVHKVEYVK